jgi:hypothetical protein
LPVNRFLSPKTAARGIPGAPGSRRRLAATEPPPQPHFQRVQLTRVMHEPPATTVDMAVLPGVLRSRTLRRTDRYASAASPCGYWVARPSPRFRYGGSRIARASYLKPTNSKILHSNDAKAHEQSKDAEDNPAPDQGHCRISHDIPSGESCQTENRQSPERLNHVGPLVSPGHHHG